MKIRNFVYFVFLALPLLSANNISAQEKPKEDQINSIAVTEALDNFELSKGEKKVSEPIKNEPVITDKKENFSSEKIKTPEGVSEDKILTPPEPPDITETTPQNDINVKKVNNSLALKKETIIDSFQVKEMDIKDALGLLSLKTGLDIVFDKNIKGNVTVSLDNVRAIDALRIILDMSNLAYNEVGDKIHIMTLKEFESQIGHNYEEELETRIVPLTYIKTSDVIGQLMKMKGPLGKVIVNNDSNGFILIDFPDNIKSMVALIKDKDISLDTEVFTLKDSTSTEILKKIEGLITKEKGSFTYDEKSNRLVVTDTFLKVKEIEGIINESSNLDKQIELTTKVIQIILSEEHMQGVDWEAIVSDYKSIPYQSFINANENQDLSIGTITEEDYDILVDALDTVGDINPVANFKETLVNQKESKVSIKLDINEVDNIKEPEKTKSDSLQLFITPRITKDSLSLDIKPELDKTKMQSDMINLKIANGSTVVLGSIFKEVKVEQIRGVPFLRELPIFKIAFRRTKQSKQKIEFVSFLTFRTASR